MLVTRLHYYRRWLALTKNDLTLHPKINRSILTLTKHYWTFAEAPSVPDLDYYARLKQIIVDCYKMKARHLRNHVKYSTLLGLSPATEVLQEIAAPSIQRTVRGWLARKDYHSKVKQTDKGQEMQNDYSNNICQPLLCRC